jgi:hypothetical protein
MRLTAAIACVVALTLAGAGSASAATIWHVDSSGGGACTLADPNCTTITAATGAASDGDTIDIAAGAYTESVATGKRLTFDGAGTEILVNPATVLTGTTSGPALKLTNGGTVRDMIVRPSDAAGTDASFKRALDFEPPATGPELSYTVSNVVATSSNAPSGSAVGNALYLDAGGRTVSLQVTDSRLVGHANGTFAEFAVSLQGANASTRLDGVTVDAADEYGGLRAESTGVTIDRSSLANANVYTLRLSQGTVTHSRVTGRLYTLLVAGAGTTSVRDSLISTDATIGGASPEAALSITATSDDATARAVGTAFRAIATDTTLAPDVKAFEGGRTTPSSNRPTRITTLRSAAPARRCLRPARARTWTAIQGSPTPRTATTRCAPGRA